MSRRTLGSIARKISSLFEDKTPQLGGDLDLNGKNIDFPTTPNISDCLDEDDMSSDSATMLSTQQSIKAYALPSPPNFTSSQQTVAADTVLDVAHGLGAKPTLVQVSLLCTTDNIGYVSSTADEVLYFHINDANSDRGATIFWDTTNVTIVQGFLLVLIDASTNNSAAVTMASWRWIVRAWA